MIAVRLLLLASLALPIADAAATEVDAATQTRLGLALVELRAAQAPVELAATVEVLDPSTLAKTADDIAALQATADASNAEARRVQALFAADGNMSRKAVEAARAQAAVDQAKLQQVRTQLRMDWGSAIAALDAQALHARAESLLDGRMAWLKAEPLAVPAAGFQAAGALLRPGDVTARVLGPLPRSTSGLAGGWLLEAPGAGLMPGMTLTARMRGAAAGATGVLLPRSAVVRWNGLAWAYVATDATHFERRAVNALAITAEGWIVGAPFKPGEKAVARGAETLIALDAAPPAADKAEED
ncbi:hypothetical protein [Dyella sp. 2RAB6]|uniref:hypothetical protein n=1 Tax=Dyella sp. 2RAB6 TaxID=3232992 RepID=UPI003F8FAC86